MSTPVHGKAFQVNANSVSWEEFLDSATLDISVDTAEVTTSGDSAKTYVEGDYGATWSLAGPADFTNTTGLDETAFGLIGGGSTTWSLLPGSGAASSTNPSYSQSVILTGYSISASVSDAVKATVSGQGTGAVTRAEA